MRSETKFCAALLSLALAAPLALAQTPATPTPEVRMLPTSAAAYAEYQGEVSSVMAKPFASAKELDRALDTFGAPNPDQLSSAWISYSAIIAAQQKDFVTAVRDIDSYYGRDRVMTGMRNDVGYARTLKGGEQALQAALSVNSRDAGRISNAGAFVKEQSYTLQSIGWGKQKIKDPKGSAHQLKASARAIRPVATAATKLFSGPDLNAMLASVSASPADAGSIWDKISVLTASAPATAFSALSPVQAAQSSLKVDPQHLSTVNRMVTLAAFHVIEADKDASHSSDVKAAMTDKNTSGCIDWAQMQLQACVSAAYTRAEVSFCLARHGLELKNDKSPSVGACFSEIAK